MNKSPDVSHVPTIKIIEEDGMSMLSEETARDLAAIALRNGISYGEALSASILNEAYLMSLEDDGHNLLIKKPHDVIRYLVRE